jgi:hypothetical protein
MDGVFVEHREVAWKRIPLVSHGGKRKVGHKKKEAEASSLMISWLKLMIG